MAETRRYVRLGSRLCENALGRRMRRIVFSIGFFRKKLPVQSTPTSTKSRWKFYTQVGHRSFHTAWVKSCPDGLGLRLPLFPPKADTTSDIAGGPFCAATSGHS